jgi:hypothetical protein
MKNRAVRFAVALVAVAGVFGLSQSPADAKVVHHHVVAKTTGQWCCS